PYLDRHGRMHVTRSDARKSLVSDLAHRPGLSPGVAGTERLVANKSGIVPTAPSVRRPAVFAIPLRRARSSSEWKSTDPGASLRWGKPQAGVVFIRGGDNKKVKPGNVVFVSGQFHGPLFRLSPRQGERTEGRGFEASQTSRIEQPSPSPSPLERARRPLQR